MNVDRLNLRHLAAALAVSRSGSISAAARQVHLTQPAITQGIGKLEAALGHRLFERRSDGMVQTRAATLLAPRIAAALSLIGDHRVTAAQARAFVAVVRSGGYAAASAAIGLSSASLHRAVRDLSLAHSQPLLERRGNGIAPTTHGVLVARRLMLARGELSAALDELASEFGRETGRITIGAMPLSRARLLPLAIKRSHLDHPEFAISIVEGSYAELIGPLRDGIIDVMIGALRPAAPGDDVAQQTLFDDRPVIVGSAQHPLADARPDLRTLAAYPWIVAARGAPLREHWERMFASAGLSLPRVPIECGSVITIREMLLGTDFLTLLSPDQVAAELSVGWLAIVSAAPPDIVRTIGVTMRRNWRPTPLQTTFMRQLDAVAAQSHS